MENGLINNRKPTTLKDPIKLHQWKIRQLKQLLSVCEQNEQAIIRARVRRNQIDLAVLLLQKDLEQSINSQFDPEVSRKLDAIQVLLG